MIHSLPPPKFTDANELRRREEEARTEWLIHSIWKLAEKSDEHTTYYSITTDYQGDGHGVENQIDIVGTMGTHDWHVLLHIVQTHNDWLAGHL